MGCLELSGLEHARVLVVNYKMKKSACVLLEYGESREGY